VMLRDDDIGSPCLLIWHAVLGAGGA
jgi:hypothetical protein